MTNITKEEILKLVDKDLLADKLAEKMVNEKTNYDTELDTALYRGLEKAAKEIVSQLLNEYMIGDAIKQWLREALGKMSKQELLNMLANDSQK